MFTFFISCMTSPTISMVIWIWIRNRKLRRMKLYCCLSVGTKADSWLESHPVTFSQNHSLLMWGTSVFEMFVLFFKPCCTNLNGVLTWFFEYKRFLWIYFEYQIEGCTVLFCFSFHLSETQAASSQPTVKVSSVFVKSFNLCCWSSDSVHVSCV